MGLNSLRLQSLCAVRGRHSTLRPSLAFRARPVRQQKVVALGLHVQHAPRESMLQATGWRLASIANKARIQTAVDRHDAKCALKVPRAQSRSPLLSTQASGRRERKIAKYTHAHSRSLAAQAETLAVHAATWVSKGYFAEHAVRDTT